MKATLLTRCAMLFCVLLSRTGFSQPPSIRDFAYPKAGYGLTGFSVLTEQMILLPYKGGVFMPGQQLWYYPPARNQIIYSASPCKADQSLYMVAQARNQHQVIRLSKNAKGQEEFEQMITLPKGLFTIFPVDAERFYMWGYWSGHYALWQQRGSRADTLLSSAKAITAVAPVGDGACFLAHERQVILLQNAQAPQRITHFDSVIDGLAIASDGSLFVSCQQGIVRIRDRKHTDLITKDFHGYLQWYGRSLYVLDQPRHRVVQVQF